MLPETALMSEATGPKEATMPSIAAMFAVAVRSAIVSAVARAIPCHDAPINIGAVGMMTAEAGVLHRSALRPPVANPHDAGHRIVLSKADRAGANQETAEHG